MFSISVHGARMVLSGHLDGSSDVYDQLSKALKLVANNAVLTIDASEITLDPSGVTRWLSASRKYLAPHQLSFEPSQLGMILELDDRYDHDNTSFGDQYAA